MASQEDLYFEMEFEVKKDDESESFSSKSVESLSECSSQLSQEPDLGDQRRGSSVGPILERPKYLR